MKKLLLLILLALGLSAEAQQTCFGSSCGSAASSSPATGADVANVTTCTDSVGTDAWACSPASCAATLGATTPPVVVTVGTANTGAATFAFCGAAAKAVVRPVTASVSTALSTGDVLAGQKIYLAYSVANDNWQMGSVSAVAPAKTLNDATYCPDVGASDAYVCSMVSAPSSYAAGMLVTLSANTANTGTASVNVNGLGVKTITRSDGSTLVTGDIAATSPVLLEYDGTNFRMISSPGSIRSLSDSGTDLTLTSRRLVIPTNGIFLDLQGGVIAQSGSGLPNYALHFGSSGGVAFGAGVNAAAFIRGHGTVAGVMQISPATATNYIEMVEVADARANYDFNIACITGLGTSGCTDPTFSIRSANQATNQALSLGHNQTQGVITANGGVLARSLTYASGSDVGLTVQGSLSGNIMNLKNSGGTTLSYFDSTGRYNGPSGTSIATSAFKFDCCNTGFYIQAGGLGFHFYGNGNSIFQASSDTLELRSTGVFAWSPGPNPESTYDTLLKRGGVAATIQMGADVNGAAVNQTFKAHDGIAGSNIAGASLTTAAGRGTGNATPADRAEQTAVPVGSGTTAQTLGDRVRVIGKYTDLTEATATAFARVAVASSTVTGGDIVVTVEANDATDFQARTITVPWSAANKAGTLTLGLGTPSEAIGASAGTLTCTITFVDSGSGKADFKADCTSSLSQTVLRANAQVRKNFGTGAISAQ